MQMEAFHFEKGVSIAPKDDTASTMNGIFFEAAILPISSIGLTMPAEVSLWIAMIAEISPLFSSTSDLTLFGSAGTP